MGTIVAIAKGIADMISTVKILDYWFRQILVQWMAKQDKETSVGIADAAALGAHAQTTEDRFKASEAWQNALTRPRVTE